ncbi:MAG: DUF1822 family protein [Cyanobacteria bacterium J06600_6]
MLLHKAFVSVLRERPELLSTEDRNNLAQQKWSNDIDKFEDQIYEWISPRLDINDETLKLLSKYESDGNHNNRNLDPNPRGKNQEIGYIQPDSPDNISQEEQTDYYRESLEKIVIKFQFKQWADNQSNLGALFLRNISGNRNENIENAITSSKAALRLYNEIDFPKKWGETQVNLGVAYLYRIKGEKRKNIETAITALSAALKVCTEEKFAQQWASVLNNLGIAYLHRIEGNRKENIENAITAFSNALRVQTETDVPFDWAITQNNLGIAYRDRLIGDRGENLEHAIAAYQSALKVYTKVDFPYEWASLQNNLGLAYSNHLIGGRKENIENAITAYQSALAVYIESEFPQQWASVQHNLGLAYSDRFIGGRKENIENAIAAYQSALKVYKKVDFPYEWASLQNNLGLAYRDRLEGDRKENIEMAISTHNDALKVINKNDSPSQWAMTQNNLGLAYYNRFTGDESKNVEEAIAYFQSTLEIYTQSHFPEQYAMVQRNLALAYCDRVIGNKAVNTKVAIYHSLAAAGQINTLHSSYHAFKLPMPINAYLPPQVYKQALDFASEQTTVAKAKQVFANTIAVHAVNSYLELIQVETELEKSSCWQKGQRTIFDISDLIVSNYGRVECRPVEPNSTFMTLPSFTEPNCRGYIAVELPVSLGNSDTTPQINEVKLLGFIKSTEITEASESVSLSSLQPLDNILDDICLIESWIELSQQNDPDVIRLQQVLGTREEEFVNCLEQFSKEEDTFKRTDRALDFFTDSTYSSQLKFKNNPDTESEESNTPIDDEELLDLVEKLWDKLGL